MPTEAERKLLCSEDMQLLALEGGPLISGIYHYSHDANIYVITCRLSLQGFVGPAGRVHHAVRPDKQVHEPSSTRCLVTAASECFRVY